MISPARQAALSSLRLFRKENTLSPAVCKVEADTRLAECIAQGVLQNERFLDKCLSSFISSGFNRLHPQILDILRLSAFQILFLERVPVSAVVNDAVSLCKKIHCAYSTGLVNAVLHRIIENKTKLKDAELSMAIRYSHPDWLVNSLLKDYSPDFVRSFLASNQQLPQIRLQINTLTVTMKKYLELLENRQIVPLDINWELNSVLIERCDVKALPGYKDGYFYVQDDAPRNAVKLAEIQIGMKVLDVCAAPGGKSIAAYMDGADVISCDLKAERLKICAENYNRLHMTIPIRCTDASVFCSEYNEMFDVVIADVPCSGSGIIRKHPEIRYKTEAQIQELIRLQQQILMNVSNYVKPGGLLLYSTCSVLKEENELQIKHFLSNSSHYCHEKSNKPGYNSGDGFYRAWPHINGNDGFFAAKLRRCI